MLGVGILSEDHRWRLEEIYLVRRLGLLCYGMCNVSPPFCLFLLFFSKICELTMNWISFKKL